MAGERKKETNGGLVLTSGLGLARIGATTLVRTAGWGVTQYSKGARRIAQAAVDPVAAAELADDVAKVTGQVADFARAVTANTPDWLFLVDEALVIRFVNRQFGAHTAEQMVSRPLLDFIPGAHRARLMDLYLTVLVSGTPGRDGIWATLGRRPQQRVVIAARSVAVRSTDGHEQLPRCGAPRVQRLLRPGTRRS